VDNGFHIYCFSEPADAQKFMARFDGEKFDPNSARSGSALSHNSGLCGRPATVFTEIPLYAKVMSNVFSDGRLLSLKASEWLILLAGSALCASFSLLI